MRQNAALCGNGIMMSTSLRVSSPLDGVDENVVYVETPMRPQGTPRRRPVSVIAINGQHVSIEPGGSTPYHMMMLFDALRKKSSKNIEANEENAGNQHFLLLPQCFLSHG